ncbi:amidohydrolase family protein [Methylobacterium soli]|uniref:Amidohydrolase family protein n=1 Tax=Methylobacterium soli TaxID=553447 RepID=A0A6L3SSK2_9HYPH|nr:amidohydrolase family protein [Methylobacterium soli]KAB1073536.1 amidohydrolase family protein [Methylobacterium soli]GJE44075.1 Imidazolonepropionase [Methylobacterium soli]
MRRDALRPAVAAAMSLFCVGSTVAKPLAFTGVRLIDGRSAQPIEDGVLIVEADRIVAAGPRTAVTVPSDAEIREQHGRTIMPGLISDHSHVGIVQGVEVGAQNYTRENILAQLKAYTARGVTTVMALGLNGAIMPEIRAEAHAGRIPGADLFGVDRGIGVPDGGPPQAMIRVSPDQLFRPTDAEGAREAVRAMKARGTDMVKLWLDDFGRSVPAKMQPAVYTAVIDEAHRLGLRVAAHVHDLEDARAVTKAGVDVLAHGVRDKLVDADLIALLKAHNTWYIATLALDEATFAYADAPAWAQTPFVRTALAPELKARFDDPTWQRETRTSAKAQAARDSLIMNLANLKVLYDAGVRIGFGTDSGAAPERVSGVAEHRELALMVQAGFTPMQALITATSRAAELLDLADRGSLEADRRADLVILAADPSEDIANSSSIVEVWRSGRQQDLTSSTSR